MIEINLLPQEFRKKGKSYLARIPKKEMVLAVLGCLVLFHLFLISLTAMSAKRLKSLKKAWQELAPEKERLDGLKKQLSEINARIPLFEQLIKNRILWSEKLNQLSESIVSGVWLNELSLVTKEAQAKGQLSKYLIIQGSCASRTKDEPALIGRFMQNLKEDPSFSSDFAEIRLGPIKKRLISQTTVMDFILTCRFKQEKVLGLVK